MRNDPLALYLPPELRDKKRDYGGYSVDLTLTAVAGSRTSDTFTVQSDVDFLCLSISHVYATDAAGGTEVTFPTALITLQDNATGGIWFNEQQHLANVAGRMADDGHGPHILEHPRYIEAGTTVTCELQNLAAQASRVWITFHGAKIYRNFGPRRPR